MEDDMTFGKMSTTKTSDTTGTAGIDRRGAKLGGRRTMMALKKEDDMTLDVVSVGVVDCAAWIRMDGAR